MTQDRKGSKKIEILAPAGSYGSFMAAVTAGADAVYAGGPRFGARAFADNFTEEQLLSAIDYAHLHGRKFYLTVNTLLKDAELEELHEYLEPLYRQGLDAVIVQDIGVLSFVREHFPGMDIHASTQMTVTNTEGALFLKEQGAVRVVPARELALEEVYDIVEQTGLEMECFVHGGALLLLLRAVPAEQPDWRTQRKQRAVCAAVQAPLYCEWKKRVHSEFEGYLHAGIDPGIGGCGG